MIQDLTAQLVAASFTGTKREVHTRFDPSVQRVKDGLYVFVFANADRGRVRDNNTNPKTVIGGESASLKPGKFENGFIERMRNYYDHLRREDAQGGIQHVFQECLRLALVFDLSKLTVGLPSSARVFENYWNESIGRFLDKENLLVGTQNGRAEWRSVSQSLTTIPVQKKLLDLVDGLAANIHKMAGALA